MRHHVHLSIPGLVLGDRLATTTALNQGLILPESAKATDQIAVSILPAGRGCSDFVHLAVDDAITESPAYLHREKLGPVYHAVTHDVPDATAIMAELHADEPLQHPAVTIKNGARGVIDALGHAALYLDLTALSSTTCAIVSAGVAWTLAAPRERWQYPTPLGDGTGAVVVSTEPGPLRLLSTATHVDALLARRTYDNSATPEALNTALKRVVAHALSDAELEPGDIDYLITPFAAGCPEQALRNTLSNLDRQALERHIQRGRNIGYLGATDLLAGLHGLLHDEASPQPGQHILMVVGCTNGSVGAAALMVE